MSSTAPSVLADDRLFVLRNSFLPADDVALGAEAARVIRAHVPLVKDRQILIGLSSLDESGTYRLAFDRVRESIQPVR